MQYNDYPFLLIFSVGTIIHILCFYNLSKLFRFRCFSNQSCITWNISPRSLKSHYGVGTMLHGHVKMIFVSVSCRYPYPYSSNIGKLPLYIFENAWIRIVFVSVSVFVFMQPRVGMNPLSATPSWTHQVHAVFVPASSLDIGKAYLHLSLQLILEPIASPMSDRS